MATAGDLCTTIIGDLGRSDVSLSDIVLIDIQSSIRDYEAQRFYFNEQKLAVTLSVTDTYALSLFAAAGTGVSDVIEIDRLEVVISASRTYEISERGFNEWAGLAGGGSGIVGYPEFYAIWGQALKIYPMANAAYVANMWAHVKLTAIAAGGFSTSNAWVNDASELIRNATLKRLWGRRFRDFDAAQAAGVAERDALMALRRRTDALSGGSLEAHL